jgi:cell wall-associated NlpC family hydrolase
MSPLPLIAFLFLSCTMIDAWANALQFDTTFNGRAKFDQLVARADQWKELPLGERVAAVGRALVGTRYKSFTLEIDDKIEAPSVNLNGLDCWTFFESALAFARMLEEPRDAWTPATMLQKIELDRYRAGKCDGTYLSRLHYLEEWLSDNARRGLVQDLTRELGGVRVPHITGEMTIHWKGYRYIRATPALRPRVRDMEERVRAMPLYHIPKATVAGIESKLRDGDIIGITTRDPGGVGTSHVGLAYRSGDGVLHFMHASAPQNYGKVVVDSRLSTYLKRFKTIAGILVARPLR